MRTLYMFNKSQKVSSNTRLLPLLVFIVTGIVCTVNPVSAQVRSNQSDWNVPPPLPPGTLPKANTITKGATGQPVTLTIGDVPTLTLPAISPVQMPALAAISTTSPVVAPPEQPAILEMQTGLPEIPSPEAPEAPSLPKQSLHDAEVPVVIDLPIPASPDLPPAPAEPSSSSGQPGNTGGTLPVIPEVLSLFGPAAPPAGTFEPWPTPGIPENAGFKMVAPAATEPGKQGGKASKKGKSR